MAEEKTENPAGLTLSDMRNLLTVVDHAAAQGAFKGWETIRSVVMVRDKLAQFIVAATPAGDDQVAVAEKRAGDTDVKVDETTLATAVVETAPVAEKAAPKKRGRKPKASVK